MADTQLAKIWKAVLSQGKNVFTISDIHNLHQDIPRSKIKTYLASCAAAGFIKDQSAQRAGAVKKYQVIKVIKKPPFYSLRGQRKFEDDPDIRNMWKAMKMMRRFTPLDLAVYASTESRNITNVKALKYIKALCETGYLKLLSGKHGSSSQYALVSNTGHYAPVLTRKTVHGVFDLNNNEVKWIEHGRN